MQKYNINDLRFMYINKPNDLAKIFEKAGYTEDLREEIKNDNIL